MEGTKVLLIMQNNLFVFKGDVYQGLDESFSKADTKFAQKHLRILSGLYGILKPLDIIEPYRLEMEIKLKTQMAIIYMIFGVTTLPKKLKKN